MRDSTSFSGILFVALAATCCTPWRTAAPAEIAVIRQQGARVGLALPDPLDTTPAMRKAAMEEVGLYGTEAERLQRLARYLLDSTRLNFRYSPRRSSTARDAFESREGDCFSYANLFAAMARVLHVPVRFVQVRSSRTFEERSGSFFVEGHVAVAHSSGAEMLVADVPGIVADWRLALYETISDAAAATLFYSNRGADLIESGDLLEAAKLLQFLIAVEPDVPEPWSNLGVVLLRQKRYRDALELLRRALARFPDFQPLYVNGALAAGDAGDLELARSFAARGRRLAKDDPYLQFGQGLAELQTQNFARAAAFFEEAARLKPDCAAFHLWLASASLSAGDAAAARAALARARALAPDLPMLRELESKQPDLAAIPYGGEHP